MEDPAWVDQLARDWRQAELTQRQRAMLAHAEKLTLQPAAMQRADVAALRAVGFEDADILALTEVVAYYAYANRIADGLGVAVEAWNIEPQEPPAEPSPPRGPTS